MKVLIIGARGMLGADLAKTFQDHETHEWDRDDLDITLAHQVREKISQLGPDLIINSAAYNAVDEAETKPEVAHLVNETGPENIARVAKELNSVFVQYSTDYVFDGLNPAGYTENDEPRPVSAYGRSKHAGERAVAAIGGKYYLIRPSRLFGLPARSANAKKSFVDVMRALAQTKTELSVVHEEYSNPTYTPDLAEWTRKLVEGDYASGIYHVVNEGACTWYELAQEIFRLIGKDIKLTAVPSSNFPRPAARPAYSSLLNTKLPKLRTWQAALEEYLSISPNI